MTQTTASVDPGRELHRWRLVAGRRPARRSRAATPRPVTLVAIAPLSGVEDAGRGRSPRPAATFDDGAWPATSGRERAAILFELARLLREEAEPLARLVATEMGKPIRYVREREIEPGHRPDPCSTPAPPG